MKGIALESIIRWIILLTAAVIIINLMLFFSDEIKSFIRKYLRGEEWKTEKVEAEKFSTAQLMTYIRACWSRTGERFHKDAICFVLKGNMSEVDPNPLKTAVGPPAQVDVSLFDPLKNMTIIRFRDIGNVIIVES